jgi:U4/U6.U5 tri-snRNP-associated protein 2
VLQSSCQSARICSGIYSLKKEVSRCSKKKFSIGKQSDPIQFLPWLLFSLHIGLGGTKKKGGSVIHDVFQGELKIESQTTIAVGTAHSSEKFSETGL